MTEPDPREAIALAAHQLAGAMLDEGVPSDLLGAMPLSERVLLQDALERLAPLLRASIATDLELSAPAAAKDVPVEGETVACEQLAVHHIRIYLGRGANTTLVGAVNSCPAHRSAYVARIHHQHGPTVFAEVANLPVRLANRECGHVTNYRRGGGVIVTGTDEDLRWSQGAPVSLPYSKGDDDGRG